MVATGLSEVKTPGVNLPSLVKRKGEGDNLACRDTGQAAPGEDEKATGRRLFSDVPSPKASLSIEE